MNNSVFLCILWFNQSRFHCVILGNIWQVVVKSYRKILLQDKVPRPAPALVPGQAPLPHARQDSGDGWCADWKHARENSTNRGHNGCTMPLGHLWCFQTVGSTLCRDVTDWAFFYPSHQAGLRKSECCARGCRSQPDLQSHLLLW